MHVLEMNPSSAPPADFAAWNDVLAATTALDLPGDPAPHPADTTAALQNPFATERQILWLCRIDGDPAAICRLTLEEPPNDGIGEVNVQVRPPVRRRGLGSALLAVAVRRLLDERRTTVTMEVADGTSGTAFGQALGFTAALADRASLLRLSEVDAGLLEELVSQPPAGYRMLRWPGRVPEEFCAGYAAAKAAMADAPTGDLVWRYPPLDEATWRAAEDTLRRRGQEFRIVAATSESSDDVAGFTEIAVLGGNPRRATQHDTGVVPAHRGRGLGLLVKAEMLRWLRAERPDVAEIETGNAQSNSHMLAINERLGFRPDRTWYEYQADVAEVEARLREPS